MFFADVFIHQIDGSFHYIDVKMPACGIER